MYGDYVELYLILVLVLVEKCVAENFLRLNSFME